VVATLLRQRQTSGINDFDPAASNPALGSSGQELVPLRVAASLVYYQLNRRLGRNENGATADFESTALALSHLTDVYYADSSGKVSRVPRADLALAEFKDGGDSCLTPSGSWYKSLAVQRSDLMEAIVILQGVRGAR
jgi:hypothetical protein